MDVIARIVDRVNTHASVFRIHLLPALHGDAIVIEYGSQKQPDFVLVDAGPKEAFEDIKASLGTVLRRKDLRLLVVTHIDTDHIDGVVKLFGAQGLDLQFDEVWFNGWPQLERLDKSGDPPAQEGEVRGPVQGEYLEVRLKQLPWNTRFSGGPVVVRDEGQLPRFSLPGGLALTLLSPVPEKLEKLKAKWQRVIAALLAKRGDGRSFEDLLESDPAYRDGNEMPRDMDSVLLAATELDDSDTSIANGSSIAFIAEFAGRRCALLGDAHRNTVAESMRRWCAENGVRKLPLTAVKLSHHGSKANIDDELLGLVDCRDFLVSTNGRRFCHPDEAAIERIIRRVERPCLHFNYFSDTTRRWADETDQRVRGYRVSYPEKGRDGITVDLMRLPPCP